jgi:hypothetical protein
MIIANHLCYVFISLKGNIPDEFSFEIDKSLTGSCLSSFDITGDRTGYALNAPFFWLRGRPDGLLRAGFGAGLTVDADIRDGGFLLTFFDERNCPQRTDFDT